MSLYDFIVNFLRSKMFFPLSILFVLSSFLLTEIWSYFWHCDVMNNHNDNQQYTINFEISFKHSMLMIISYLWWWWKEEFTMGKKFEKNHGSRAKKAFFIVEKLKKKLWNRLNNKKPMKGEEKKFLTVSFFVSLTIYCSLAFERSHCSSPSILYYQFNYRSSSL